MPLFHESGFLTGEKETKEMLDAIQKATTIERLNAINQSRLKGFRSRKITEEQAKRLANTLALKRSQLQSTSQTKVA